MLNVENVNAKFDDGTNDTLLHKAIRKGYRKIVNELLIYHADVDTENDEGLTALTLASLEAPSKIVTELLNHKVDVNERSNLGSTALICASLRGNHEIVIELLNHHADVNAQDQKGDTALMCATKSQNYEIVIELLNHHADVNVQDEKGETALVRAIESQNYEIVKELLNHHADVNIQAEKGDTALMCAIEYQKYEIVIELLNHYANVNVQDEKGNTALIRAIECQNYDIVMELLNHHADVNAQNEKGETALMLAAYFEYHDIVIELLNHHADVNAQNKDGTTALMFATEEKEDPKIMIELLNHHADVNIQANNGFTALMIAANMEHNLFVSELCNHNADVNLQNSDGDTALHLTLTKDVTDTTINIVKLLLPDSTNLEIINKENKSVIGLAKESPNQDLAQLIDDFYQQKKVEATRRELKKLQANQILSKKNQKLLQIKALKDEERDLSLQIYQVQKRNAELAEKIQRNREQIETWQCALNRTRETEGFKSYEKLQEDIKYLEKCIHTETFDDVIQLAKRECPICFNEMKPSKKIYQCQTGHILCEECFGKVKERTKICPSCKVNIASSPIRCRTLEEVIEDEACK